MGRGGGLFPEELEERFEHGVLLGRGSSSQVWRTRERATGRAVALKVFSPRSEWEDELPRFLQEAEQAKRLEHPNLVPVLDFDVHPGRTSWIAYEFIQGRTFRNYLDRERRDAELVLDWLAQIAEALDALHQEGLAHRDVKPANILIRDDGRAFLCDLGMLRLPQSAIQTTTGRIHGTPHYIAPEVWNGAPANAATDQFSLGVCLLEALHDRKAYAADAIGDIFQWALGEEELDLPGDCLPVVRRALAREPGARYRDLLELAAELRSPPILMETTRLEVFQPRRRRRWPALVTGAALLLGAAGWAWMQPRPSAVPSTAHIERAEARVEEKLRALTRDHPGRFFAFKREVRDHLNENRGVYLASNLPRRWRELTEAIQEWVSEQRLLPRAQAASEVRGKAFVAFMEPIRHLMFTFARLDGKSLGLVTGLAFGNETVTMEDITLCRANWVAIIDQMTPLVAEITEKAEEEPPLVLALAGELAGMLETRHRIPLAPAMGRRAAEPDLGKYEVAALLSSLDRCLLATLDETSPTCDQRLEAFEAVSRRIMEAPPGSPWTKHLRRAFMVWMHTAGKCRERREELLERSGRALDRIEELVRSGGLEKARWSRAGAESHLKGILREDPRGRILLDRLASLVPPVEGSDG